MLLALLGYKVLFGNIKLFLACVTLKLDDFHSVKESRGYRRRIVGGGDKEHLAQIVGHIDIVILKRAVLLRVKSL